MSKISAKARRELIATVAERYQVGTGSEKGCILDEFVALMGYHRKRAFRILNGRPAKAVRRRGRRCLYDQAVTEALVVLWEASDRVCGERLKALLTLLVPALRMNESCLRIGHDANDLALRRVTMDNLRPGGA